MVRMGVDEPVTLHELGLETKTLLYDVLEESKKGRSDGCNRHLFEAEADRFGLWAMSLGLFVPGHGSLDYRVREAENIKSMIKAFLETLNSSLREVLEYFYSEDSDGGTGRNLNDSAVHLSDSEESDDDWGEESDVTIENHLELLLDDIRDPIDRLYKLSIWIRNPSSRFASSKMLSHKHIDPDTGADLLEVAKDFDLNYIESVFLQYRQSKLQEENQRPPAVRFQDEPPRDCEAFLAGHKKPIDASYSFLVHRLALANFRRRQQFSYWRKHREKVALHMTAADSIGKKDTNLDDTGVNSVVTQTMHHDHLLPIIQPLSVTTATYLQVPQHALLNDNQSSVSISKYAPSNWQPGNENLEFPPAPKHLLDRSYFECPYCYTLCPETTLGDAAWKAHLIHDLRPYVCTYEDCKSPNQLYDTRSDWLQHEGSAHRRIYHCPKHPIRAFLSLVEFQEHIKDGHLTADSKIPPSLVIQANETTLTVPDRPCPICLMSLSDMNSLQKHIALHLERFALFSLPRGVCDDENNDVDSNMVNENRGVGGSSQVGSGEHGVESPETRSGVWRVASASDQSRRSYYEASEILRALQSSTGDSPKNLLYDNISTSTTAIQGGFRLSGDAETDQHNEIDEDKDEEDEEEDEHLVWKSDDGASHLEWLEDLDLQSDNESLAWEGSEASKSIKSENPSDEKDHSLKNLDLLKQSLHMLEAEREWIIMEKQSAGDPFTFMQLDNRVRKIDEHIDTVAKEVKYLYEEYHLSGKESQPRVGKVRERMFAERRCESELDQRELERHERNLYANMHMARERERDLSKYLQGCKIDVGGRTSFICNGVSDSGGIWGCSRHFDLDSDLISHWMDDTAAGCLRVLVYEKKQDAAWGYGQVTVNFEHSTGPFETSEGRRKYACWFWLHDPSRYHACADIRKEAHHLKHIHLPQHYPQGLPPELKPRMSYDAVWHILFPGHEIPDLQQREKLVIALAEGEEDTHDMHPIERSMSGLALPIDPNSRPFRVPLSGDLPSSRF